MLSTNQRCNYLQGFLGVFQRSCNTPDKVLEVFAHMGVSISPNAVTHAVSSLSEKAIVNILKTGHTLCTSFAYDNFDVELPTTRHGVDQSTVKLHHLTSALLVPLQHGVTPQDLQCSEELWKVSPYNSARVQAPKVADIDELMEIHPDTYDQHNMTRRDRFNAHIFRRDLLLQGPAYFKRFKNEPGSPELIDCIPLERSTQVPAYAMDVSNSTVAGNISAVNELLTRAGVGDPVANPNANPPPSLTCPSTLFLFTATLGLGSESTRLGKVGGLRRRLSVACSTRSSSPGFFMSRWPLQTLSGACCCSNPKVDTTTRR